MDLKKIKLDSKLLKTTNTYIQKLNENDIFSVYDLLMNFPRGYEDRRQIKLVSQINPLDNINTVKGKIIKIISKKTLSRKIIIEIIIEDDAKKPIRAVFFGQKYLLQVLKENMVILLSGKIKYSQGEYVFSSPDYEILDTDKKIGEIIGIYKEIDSAKKYGVKISSKWQRNKIILLKKYFKYFSNLMPNDIIAQENLLDMNVALYKIHFPTKFDDIKIAKKTIGLNQVFVLLKKLIQKKEKYRKLGKKILQSLDLNPDIVKEFLDSLPFMLTDSQKICIYQMMQDLEKDYPMTRLLQGDVGSGKTIVVLTIIYYILKLVPDAQIAFMVPTEILAKQHFETIKKFFNQFDINIELLIGSKKKLEKDEIAKRLKTGDINLVVGTHALIQENISFKKLFFVVVDEQHRFGVMQRQKLASFGYPHILHMTATPIPRTLALTLYGDQDISIINQMPAGRKPIYTKVIRLNQRDDIYRFVVSEIQKGRQAYVICPLIEESEKLVVKSAEEEFKRLKENVFQNISIDLIHGKKKTNEKDEIMKRFYNNEISILVSTSVIEVGIDVKNASIMIIESAERFGLAQLHQFRGRIGRGKHKSYCFLFQTDEDKNINERLKAMEKYIDGFYLAEIDMKMRGFGEIYGTMQSGYSDLEFISELDIKDIIKVKKYIEKGE